MNLRSFMLMFFDALLGFVITLATTLTALLSQNGISKFSDVSEVSYAIAILGAVIGSAKVVQSHLVSPK